jgi:2-dehydro-3-deoxygluconokinase
MKRFDFVALGEPMVEFNQTHPGQPDYLQGFGGDTSNATLAAARAGARTAYLTRLGNDPWGKALLALWATEGVNTDAIDLDPAAPTGVYFVTHGSQGHEFSYLRAGSAASRMSPDTLSPTARQTIKEAQWLHVSGISLAISTSACDTVLAAMAWARECKTQVSLDANLRLKLWPLARAQACLKQAITLCDVFLPSEDEVKPLMGADDPLAVLDWAQQLGARHVVLKRGAQGAVVRTGAQQFDIAGHAVQRVDATGAGDCFAGNLLTRLAKGDGWLEAAQYANAAAALSVQGYGAVAPLPRPEAVRALLENAAR